MRPGDESRKMQAFSLNEAHLPRDGSWTIKNSDVR
jgi:hypothetical protein